MAGAPAANGSGGAGRQRAPGDSPASPVPRFSGASQLVWTPPRKSVSAKSGAWSQSMRCSYTLQMQVVACSEAADLTRAFCKLVYSSPLPGQADTALP
jgi:hypothetical protein